MTTRSEAKENLNKVQRRRNLTLLDAMLRRVRALMGRAVPEAKKPAPKKPVAKKPVEKK